MFEYIGGGYFMPSARIIPKKTSVLSMTPWKYSEPGPIAFNTISSAACTSEFSLQCKNQVFDQLRI